MRKVGAGIGAILTILVVFALAISVNIAGGIVSVYAEGPEICNYIDDDGDGLCFGGSNDGNICIDSSNCLEGSCITVDEDFAYNGNAVGASCDGVGECGGGLVYCVDENTSDCSTNPGRPDYDGLPEICDYLDNDCDSLFDEDFAYNGNAVGASCDGVGECGGGLVYCVDTSKADCSTNPEGPDYDGSPETCNGLDDDCDGTNDDGGDALCDNDLWCDGSETCTAGACTSGTPVDCSSNDIPSIATCTNNPDNIIFTWDFFPGFDSECNEASDSCTTGTVSLTHTCDTAQCGATCDEATDYSLSGSTCSYGCDTSPTACNYQSTCSTESYCSSSMLFENGACSESGCSFDSVDCDSYDGGITGQCGVEDWSCDAGSPSCQVITVTPQDSLCPADFCSGDIRNYDSTCGTDSQCHYSTEDCGVNDGWYDTGATRWIETGECTEKEQKEQEYRDYTCGTGVVCVYSVTSSQWVDTGTPGNKNDGTVCEDGLFCTVGDQCTAGVCSGSLRDCSAFDGQCNAGVCDEVADACEAQPANEGFACDDGLFCNVGEVCQSGACVGGSAYDCSDGIGCTADECNEASDSCTNTPVDVVCDNGLWCDGSEFCDAALGCQSGTPPYEDDGVGCTDEACDEQRDKIIHLANDENCDNGLWCDGAETCHAKQGCKPGRPVDCSANDLPIIATCTNNPDKIIFTWDFFPGFISACDDASDSCTSTEFIITHTCDIAQCGAECESAADCGDTDCDQLDGCVGSDYHDYEDAANTCQGTCECTQNACGEPAVSPNDSRCTGPAVEYEIPLNRGWTFFGPIFEPTDTSTNRSIPLGNGMTMFGYSSTEPFLWENAMVSDGIEIKTISEATAAGWMDYDVYVTYDGIKFRALHKRDPYLRQGNGYMVETNQDGLTLILPGVGGSLPGNSLYWSDAKVTDGKTTIGLLEAIAAGWIEDSIKYFDKSIQDYKYVSGDSNYFYAWEGYFIFATSNKLSLVM